MSRTLTHRRQRVITPMQVNDLADGLVNHEAAELSGMEARLIVRAFADLRNAEIDFIDNYMTRDELEQHRRQYFSIVEYVVNHLRLPDDTRTSIHEWLIGATFC